MKRRWWWPWGGMRERVASKDAELEALRDEVNVTLDRARTALDRACAKLERRHGEGASGATQ